MSKFTQELITKWRHYDLEERNFLRFWLCLSILLIATEIATGLGWINKRWMVLPLLIAVVAIIGLFSLTYLAKYRPVSFPLKMTDEITRNKWLNNLFYPVIGILPVYNFDTALSWAPVWFVILFRFTWLVWGNYLLFTRLNVPFTNPKGDQANIKPMKEEKVFLIFLFGFTLLLCLFGLLTYLNLQKVI